jgi:Concanavalin A-like lectin/glucanases superfamily
MDQIAIVDTGANGSIDLGTTTVSPINFNADFTVETWVRNTDPSNVIKFSQIMQLGPLFVGIDFPGAVTVVFGQYVVTGRTTHYRFEWIHLAITRVGNTLNLYTNGVLQNTQVMTTPLAEPPSVHFVLGSPNLNFQTCRFWSVGFLAADMYTLPWSPDPVPGTSNLAASYDFSATPPVDVSGNNHPVTLLSGAQSVLIAPGVWMNGDDGVGSWAIPVDKEGLNDANQPFTISVWLMRLDSGDGVPAIYTNARGGDPGAIVLGMDRGSITFQRGSSSFESTFIPNNDWTHVAVTYTGRVVTVYVNGVSILQVNDSNIEPTPLAFYPAIGALSTASGGYGNFFHGYVQYLTLWNIALDDAQVQASVYNDPTFQDGCLSNFSFSQTQPVDLNDGSVLTLGGNAKLQEQRFTWNGTAKTTEETATAAEDVFPVTISRERLERAAAVVRSINPIHSAQKTVIAPEEHIELLLNEMRSWIPEYVSESDRENLLAEHEQNLRDLFESGCSPVTGAVTHSTVDGFDVFSVQTDDGPVEWLRVETGVLDPCTTWWLKFIGTVLFGVAGMLGLGPGVGGRGNAFVTALMADVTFMAAAAPIFTGVVTAQTILSFLSLLYTSGYLWTFFKYCFTKLSWMAIGRIALYIVGLFIPAPSPAKVQFAVSAVRLIYNITTALQGKPC